MNRPPSTPLLLLLFLVTVGCRDANKAKSFEQMVDRIGAHYVGDRRTDRFEIEHASGYRGLTVRGYTTVPAAYDSLRGALATGFVVARNDFRLLPDAAKLNGRTAGVVNVSVANLRSEPGHSQELATQALLGTPLQVLDERDGWYLVRTPDRYLAWLEPGAFVALRPAAVRAWLTADLVRVVADRARVTTEPNGGTVVTEVTAGALLRRLVDAGAPAGGAAQAVALPDGVTGYVPAGALGEVTDWRDTLAPSQLVAAAATHRGTPYLWGGTSPKAVDCSGLTKTAYYDLGFVIPRDASQQVHAGDPVSLTEDLDQLAVGDLLFFGGYRADGSEKITHVGVYTGAGRFLHAGADNGRVTEQSLLPGAPDYAAHRRESLLRARRLSAGSPGVVRTWKAFADLVR